MKLSLMVLPVEVERSPATCANAGEAIPRTAAKARADAEIFRIIVYLSVLLFKVSGACIQRELVVIDRMSPRYHLFRFSGALRVDNQLCAPIKE